MARAQRGSSAWIAPAVGLAAIAGVALVMGVLMRTSYDLFAALIVGSILIAISLPALFGQAEREHDPRFTLFLIVALLAKLAGAVARYFVSFGVYGGRSDAAAYWNDGLIIGPQLRHGIFTNVHIFGLSGTNFIRFVSGVSVATTGPSLLAGYLLFSWIGFWGLFFFYRAFTIAVPEGRRRWYAVLVFFLPSLIFWPSGVGKEAWMVFGLGLCAFGIARVLTGRAVNGLLYTALGAVACAVVRPHIAAMVAIALVVALLVRPSSAKLGALGPVAKIAALIPVLIVSVFLIMRAQAFLKTSGINTSKGLATVGTQVADRTQKGGSRFAPSVLSSPWLAPSAAVTVLFRPLIYEAGDLQSMVAALEGTFLIVLCFVRFRWIGAALSMLRKRPYLTFALTYLIIFVAAYSSIANFGILVRERVQVLPLFLAFLCVPPRSLRRRQARERLAREDAATHARSRVDV